ncbi:DUF551 domain-containing protein [Klebsiella pneumoniae]|uniref:DUF551 domain-containing protein n=2 Tax=Klebsiella pneumoniae TaxID=573 RepID=UPI000C1F3B77|nr:DUF551 domain-containing protein [Klebsiella pneumoniae]SXZ94178.1 Eaa1 [Klebsiella pneumoniae]HBR3650323.1 DUF551 domain-containing protein [Klebsiella pneumoniae]HBU3839394.1 DUF551 domain-containing protein [Klebsiella pneumoniae]HBY7716947.1 DUF551 domain-containing protein [Klebsiella pneumoniae]HBY7744409.1 DUF551 domain-containing protein [Klebsiella pneumoniae]
MTKSTITRERLAKIKSWRETYGAGSNVMLPAEEAEELARIALAAMNGEPVAEVLSNRPGNDTSTIDRALPVGTQLYLHAQPEPVVPDAATAIRACLSEFPESARDIVEECADIAENACRAAMLQELQKSAGAEATCRSNENVQVLHTKSPAQSDCCPAQNGDTPAQSQGWIPVSERMPTKQDGSVFLTWNGQYIGKELFLMGSFQCLKPEIITHWMPLPAAPQEVK